MRTLVILGLAYILFVHGLGNVPLWDPDEPRQALMAREMIDRADYVHPYLNGLPYLEKPPLYPWLIILTSKITGRVDELSSRLPSALAATLLLLLTYFLGRRLDHEVSGFLSALILATNYQFLANARESVMDMTFAFFMGLTVFLGYLSIEKGRRWLLPFSLLPCAFAILTKGPAGLVIPVAVLFFYCLATKRLRAMFVPMVAGCLLSLAVASVWFLLAGEAALDEFVLRQNVTRYATGFDHIEDYAYYFPKLFFNFLPWSIALPFAAFFAYRKRLWLPLLWLLVGLLFFEFSKSKRAIYLLPCYPACAILVGVYLKERWYVLLEKGWTKAVLYFLGLVLMAVPLLLFPAMQYVPIVGEMFGRDVVFPLLLTLILFVTSLAFLLSLAKQTPEKGFLALFIYLVLLGFVYHSVYVPAVDRTVKSVRPLTDELKGVPPTTPIYTYRFTSAALIFYLGRPVHILKEASEIPPEEDDIMVIVEDRQNNADLFRGVFPFSKAISYEKTNYVIFARKDGR